MKSSSHSLKFFTMTLIYVKKVGGKGPPVSKSVLPQIILFQAERERRRHDLHEQSEDHKATVDTIRADYAVLVDKIKEIKAMELEASNEARDSSKAIDMLLNQMTSNMDEVSGLRQGLEDR